MRALYPFVLKLYNPFNLGGFKAFLRQASTAFCKMLCGKEIVMNMLISDESSGAGSKSWLSLPALLSSLFL